jgi:hypothetical protein
LERRASLGPARTLIYLDQAGFARIGHDLAGSVTIDPIADGRLQMTDGAV